MAPPFIANRWAICPVDQAEEITRLVPGAELAVFERSGHSPQVEEPEAFTARLAAFLGVSARRG